MSDDSNVFASNPLHSRDRLVEEITKVSATIENIDESCPERKRQLAKLYNERGYMKYLQVEFVGAVRDFTSAIGYDPNLTTAYYNRGLIHYRLARYSEAIKDMKTTLQLDPDFQSAASCLQQATKDNEKHEVHN